MPGVTEYDRDCDPPPQPAEQVLQLPQLPVQFTAQACVLHDCVCGDAGQAAPPPLATCVTEYDRDCDPPPQPAEQVLQLPQLPVQLTAGGGDGGGTAPATVIVLATSVW